MDFSNLFWDGEDYWSCPEEPPEPRFKLGQMVSFNGDGPFPICWMGFSGRHKHPRYGIRIEKGQDLKFVFEDEIERWKDGKR